MSNIIPFKFEARELRVINDDSGSFEVVAKDAAEALGYTWQANVIGHVPEEWKGVRPINTPGGVQMMSTLTEAGLYFFLGRSDKPDALPMQKWVAGEVLPSIRKTGSYAAPKAGASQIRLAYDAAKAFPPLFRVARLLGCDKNAAAISANQMVTQLTDVNLMAGLGHVHLVAAKQDTQYFTPTELGKQIRTSARGVNLLLAEAGMQMKRGDVWEVTEAGREFARILDTGKKHGSGVPIQQVKWSPNVLPLLGSEKEAA